MKKNQLTTATKDQRPLAFYEDLPKAAVDRLERCAANIDKAVARSVESMLDVGRQLKIAHDELANHGNGTFGKWCKERLGITSRSAERYLGAIEAFGQKDCDSLSQSFTCESLYLLSRDSTPDDAIDAALKAAESGERINLQKAKAIIAPFTVTSVEDDDFNLDAAIAKLRKLFDAQAVLWPAQCRSELVHFWKQAAEERAGDPSWLDER